MGHKPNVVGHDKYFFPPLNEKEQKISEGTQRFISDFTGTPNIYSNINFLLWVTKKKNRKLLLYGTYTSFLEGSSFQTFQNLNPRSKKYIWHHHPNLSFSHTSMHAHSLLFKWK